MIELWGTFLSLAGAFLTTGTQLFLFDAVFPRRAEKKNTLKQITIWSLASFFLAGFLLVPFGYLPRSAIELIFLYLFCHSLHRSGWDRRLFVVITVYAVLFSFTYWFRSIGCWMLGVSPQELTENIALYSVLFLLSGVVSLVIARLACRHHPPLDLPEHPRAWITPSLVFPLGTLLVLWQSYSAAQDSDVWQICLLIFNAADVAALLLLDYLEMSSYNREKLVAANERVSIQEENIRALSQAYTGQRKMTHDFRAHLAALSALLEEGKIEEGKRYLAELKARQTERILLVNSHHAAIDAVLNQKAYTAQEWNIDFHCEVNDLSGVSIPDKDLAVVLGNLLDNALEACQRLSPGQVRWIRVKLLLSREDRQLFLSIENSSLPLEIKGDILPTTKADPTLHGYGLPNVFAVLKRYNADWTMNCREGVFLFALEWPEEPAL